MLVAALAAACARDDGGADAVTFERPATHVDYAVTLEGAPSDEVDALLRQMQALFRRREDGAQSVPFLRARARSDVDVARRVLRSAGYFDPTIETDVAGPPEPEAPAQATVRIDPGPLFTLARHDILLARPDDDPLPPLDAAGLGSPVGGPAAAGPILAAEGAALRALRRNGRPYAQAGGRTAVADMDAATIAVTTTIDAGGYYVFGAPVVRGDERVKPGYITTYRTWEPGAPYDEALLETFHDELIDTQLFDVVTTRPPEEPPEGTVAPVVVSVQEGLRRSASAGVRFNSDDGPAVRGRFEHRNLFGANERLEIDALAGLDEQRIDFAYTEPQFLRPGQDFISTFGVRHIEDDAFDETAATLTAGLRRELSAVVTVGAGGLLEYTETTDTDGTRDFYLAGLPAFVDVDTSDDLLDPSEGVRARLEVTPFTGLADPGADPLFLRINAVASGYQALDAERLYVLAGRARLGSIPSSTPDDIPAGRRLYSGGEGSVRGYERRSIGPLDDQGDPLGGRSVAEVGVEMRAQAFDPIGVVGFVEGGLIGENELPDFDEDPQWAAGGGVRYRSPVGPIRLDVAVPLNRRDSDSDFQFYISIGQAF